MSTTVDGSSALTGFQTTATDTSSATDKGTTIVQAGDNTLDRNSFLKILTAELANQDPLSENNDPTQYVAQLAQFSSLEQMANLNGTMSLNSASNLIGKAVKFKDTDSLGQNFVGIIKSVTKNGDNISLNFDYIDNGKTTSESIDLSHVISIIPNNDATTDSTKALSLASNLIGKTVKFSDTDSSGNNYEGVVKSVSKDVDLINLSVEITDSSGNKTTKDLNYNDVISVTPTSTDSTTSSSSASTTA